MSIDVILEYELDEIITNAEFIISEFEVPLELWDEELRKNRFDYELEDNIDKLKYLKLQLKQQIFYANSLMRNVNKLKKSRKNHLKIVK